MKTRSDFPSATQPRGHACPRPRHPRLLQENPSAVALDFFMVAGNVSGNAVAVALDLTVAGNVAGNRRAVAGIVLPENTERRPSTSNSRNLPQINNIFSEILNAQDLIFFAPFHTMYNTVICVLCTHEKLMRHTPKSRPRILNAQDRRGRGSSWVQKGPLSKLRRIFFSTRDHPLLPPSLGVPQRSGSPILKSICRLFRRRQVHCPSSLWTKSATTPLKRH